jgi:predicted nucleic acid-binding protein
MVYQLNIQTIPLTRRSHLIVRSPVAGMDLVYHGCRPEPRAYRQHALTTSSHRRRRSRPAIEGRAVKILTLLADRGQHRAPSIPDLIIAATAELAGLTVLHLDKDFEIIAGITGQPLERLNIS